MNSTQLSLPGLPVPAKPAAFPRKREANKGGYAPSLELRLRKIEDRLFQLELESTLLGDQIKQLGEDEDE